MSDELGAYARLYLRLRDDEKFAEVFSDDHHFAAYCRLLMNAEASWPASAHIPFGIRRSSIQKLELVGLVELRPGHLYRIRGLDAERERRTAKASKASNARWNAPSNAPSIATASDARMPIQAEPSKDEPSQDAHTAGAHDPADVYWTLTGRYPSEKVVGWIDDLASRFGAEPVIRAIAKAHIEDRSTSTLMGRVDDTLRSEARALSLKAQEAERQRLKERRAAPREIVDPAALQAEVQRILRGEAA
jgi:hypothetical protein